MALWIHGTILDRPTVTSYGDIMRDDGNPSRANIKQALGSIKGVTTFSSQIAAILLLLTQRHIKDLKGSIHSQYTFARSDVQDIPQRKSIVHTKMYSELSSGERSSSFKCSNDIKSKIKILDHKHAKGTAKNSQDNKVLRLEYLTSNKSTQDIRNEFEELYASANEELYPGCDYVTRLDYMAKFTFFKVKDHKDKQFYPVCNTSKWKDSNTPGKKVPKKVLRYFLIISTLQCLYKSSHTAKEMTWHATGKCTKPSKMQHPVDGRAWKNIDTKYLDFAKEPRNVRLGLVVDGFNLFGNLSHSYSMWPVILTTYNLPPWLCMKESSFMLTLLIPSLKSLGKEIDVYLRPLIDDLKDL
uniref:Uncharacterized protein n=1 Tax=Tanacetum cinerariifolium TaxID=118510 RepID=A0A6L2M3N1_TANCI|nr:hypothetical protein [Tanacetum cinerariifolium]